MPTLAYVIKHVLPSLEGKALFFHWGGHGIVDDDRERHLFASDATEYFLESVEVPTLLRFLRSTRIKALEQQWFVIDACANRFRHAASDSALAPLGLPILKNARRHSQYVMFAASVGETAANLIAERKGLFSGEVLDALMAMPAGEWPPDMVRVSQQIDERFARRPSGRKPEYGGIIWTSASRRSTDRSPTQECTHRRRHGTVPNITLHRESHVFNVNGLIGPLAGLTLSAGAQSEWTREHGYGSGNLHLLPLRILRQLTSRLSRPLSAQITTKTLFRKLSPSVIAKSLLRSCLLKRGCNSEALGNPTVTSNSAIVISTTSISPVI